MADKTFGFKVTDDVYDRAKMMIEASGLSSKEWFENALATYEVKSLQSNAAEFAPALSELELHTTRIYDLVVNMVQQSLYSKDQAVRDVSEQVIKKDALISEIQEKLQSTKEQVNQLQAEATEKSELLTVTLEQLEEARKSNENNQLLIQEYKEKNDTLSGLVTKYQAFADENERLKADFSREKAELQEKSSLEVTELKKALNASTEEVKTLTSKVAQVTAKAEEEKIKFENERAILEERKAIEHERALINLEREYQEKLQEQILAYNDKIAQYQTENDRIRASYEERLNELIIKKEK